jgi:LysM repeat protein
VRRGWQHYAAPAAFLLAATIAVILIRAGFEHGGSGASTPTVAATTGTATPRYYTVRAGDTYAVIAKATGVSVVVIRRLNPGVSSTSLFIGQRIRVR